MAMTETATTVPTHRVRFPGFSGAISVLLALGLTELAAGWFVGVPSAIASVGSIIVDTTPSQIERFAISVFGTADKGALAIGTIIVALLVGVVIGRFAAKRFWIAVAAFSAFALFGVAAQLSQPGVNPPAAVLATVAASAAGLGTLWLLLRWEGVAEMEDSRPGNEDRRRFVMLAGAAVIVGAAGVVAGRQAIIRRSEAARSATPLPEAVTRIVEVGPEHQFDIEGLTPIVVEAPDFYRIDTALIVPIVSADTWKVTVRGMVDNELELGLDDLKAMPQHERFVTIACVSNRVGDDLIGNAKWQGVRLTEVLEMAGIKEGATQIVGRSVDGWTSGFPTDAAFDGRDPLIAIGMNDEPLPRRHGYPARLIVPGLYGYVSATKWLDEIELTTWDGFDGYWIPRGWAKEGPIKTQSRIDKPRSAEEVPMGEVVAAGVAWAPTRGIAKVEVQVDENPWIEAELTEPLSDEAWVQWKAGIDVGSGRHSLKVRATDGDGVTQTSERSPPSPDGATGWHTIEFSVA